MRTTSAAGRLLAALFLALILSLTMAGAAQAASNQSNGSNGSNASNGSNTSNGAGGTAVEGSTQSQAFGATSGGALGRTGATLWIPMTVGGSTIVIALATRALLRSRVL